MAVDDNVSTSLTSELLTPPGESNTNQSSQQQQQQQQQSNSPVAVFSTKDASAVGRNGKVCGGGGGGRRKQCRPTRVLVEDLAEFPAVDDRGACSPENTTTTMAVGTSDGIVLDELNGITVAVCELCGHEARSRTGLELHRQAVHDNDAEQRKAEDLQYPTRYHQLGSELKQELESVELERQAVVDALTAKLNTPSSVDHFNEPSDLSNGDVGYDDRKNHGRIRPHEGINDSGDFPAALDFTIRSEVETAQPRQLSVPPQVKNEIERSGSGGQGQGHKAEMAADAAEDFCDRCQKHFCNKYYLKKHRHDVHGIAPQSEITSTVATVTSAHQDTHGSYSISVAGAQQPTSQKSASHENSLPVSMSATISSSHLPVQLSPYQPSLVTSLPFVLPYQPSTSGLNSVSLFQPPISSSSSAGNMSAGLIPGLTSLMLLNPFASSLAILSAPNFLQSPAAAGLNFAASSSLNTLAELQKSNSAVSSGIGFNDDMMSSLGALMNPFLTTSLQDSAVEDTTQSHYCDICRKEFCNEYFLTVHRRDKHGISTDSASAGSRLPSSSTALSDAIRLLAASNGSRSGLDTGLLQGIEPGEKLSPSRKCSSSTSQGDKLSSQRNLHINDPVSSDELCCLCKKSFPNHYALAVHLMGAHNIRPDGFGLAGELLQLDGLAGGLRPNTIPSSSTSTKLNSTPSSSSGVAVGTSSGSASKQSDRVLCDICNKEVCNKYFLKTHKMKVHGLDSAAASIYNVPDHPAVSSGRNPTGSEPRSPPSTSSQHGATTTSKHEDMRRALLMADNMQFNAFASQLDFALKSSAENCFGALPNNDRELITASDIFRMFGMIGGGKIDDAFPGFGLLPPPPIMLGEELNGNDGGGKSGRSVELKIPRHTPASPFHKDGSASGNNSQGTSSGKTRSSSSSGHHHHKHSKDSQKSGPTDQELIQSGIDPEAYCELCQKEFCSKYFLRTHRQKIHGATVKGEPVLPSGFPFDPFRSLTSGAPSTPLLQFFPGILPPPTTPFPPLIHPPPAEEGSPQSADGGAAAGGSSARTSKEAANATRVTCDVCGKELCNKYFLRTHMAKIHGIGAAPNLSGGGSDSSRGASLDISTRPDGADQNTDASDGSEKSSSSVENLHSLHSPGPRSGPSDAVITSSMAFQMEARNFSSVSGAGGGPEAHSSCANTTREEELDCNKDRQNAEADRTIIPELTVRALAASIIDEETSLKSRNGFGETVRDKMEKLEDPPEKERHHRRNSGDQMREKRKHETDDNEEKSQQKRIKILAAEQRSENNARSSDALVSSPVQKEPTNDCKKISLEGENRSEICLQEDVIPEIPLFSSAKFGLPLDAASQLVNGHVDDTSPVTKATTPQTASAEIPPPRGVGPVHDGPMMQPFIMQQESTMSEGGPAESDVLQFAPCRVYLPVVRALHDPVTVEFNVTPLQTTTQSQ